MDDVHDVQPCTLGSTYPRRGSLHSGNEWVFYCKRRKHQRRQIYLPAKEVLIGSLHGLTLTR